MRILTETIAIGDEILTGKISDTNSTFVATGLFELGLMLQRQNVVSDDIKAMTDIIVEVANRADLVACFGGLGPTSDDKTVECVTQILGGNAIQHDPSMAQLTNYYALRQKEVTREASKQILYPEKATPLPNLVGMAPGFKCYIGDCLFFFFPGVPSEMKPMVEKYFFTEVRQREIEYEKILSHSWWCIGIWESELQKVMTPIENKLPKNAWLGYRTKPPENHLSIYVRASTKEDHTVFDELVTEIKSLVSSCCFTEEMIDLEFIVGRELKKRNWKIGLAESCTGGLVASRLTQVPGSSDWVWGSYVSYQIEAKDKMLGVGLANPEDAVSASCTLRLAKRVKEQSGCDISAAITGYLAPTGGTKNNPQGTVYLTVVGPTILEQKITVSSQSREQAKWSAASHLLNLIRLALSKSE